MHEKLSQAVKLYDQILTQQVSHPRWRTTSLGPQSHQAYTATNTAPNGYTQWSPQKSPTHQLQYRPFEPAATERMTSPAIQTPSLPMNQPQYVHPYQQQQAYQVEQPQYMISTNVPVSIPPPVQSLSYAQPPSSYLPSSPLQSTPTPKPASLPQSPPVIQYQQQLRPQIPSLPQQTNVPAVGSTLVRHNTVAYHNPSSPPVPTSSSAYHLGRSNTVIGTPQRSLHQAHNVVNPQTAGTAVLPQFPSVPTSVPEPTFSIHAPTITSGFEHEERKEALLIDL